MVMNMFKSSVVKLAGLLLLGVALSAQGFSDKQRSDIEARIKPAGQLCMEGDSGCGAAVAAIGGAAKSPEDIYNTNCMACHSTGAAGAPKMGDVADWSGRLDKGIEQVYAHAINGFNGMPAKGLCMSCSDDDIKAVVDFIVDGSK
ncbi:MAG: cytochrome c5 [Oceanicoccus sp.]|jgi:cytochrome c5